MDMNLNERNRLFANARAIEIDSHKLELGCELIRKKMNERKTPDAFLETKRNGKTIFVGWIAKWGNDYHVTFMGHTFAYVEGFENGVRELLKLGYALHTEDYSFKYGV